MKDYPYPLESYILIKKVAARNCPINYKNFYQNNFRIYLDEFKVEEVDLRVNFDTSLLMKRFLKRD